LKIASGSSKFRAVSIWNGLNWTIRLD